MSKKNRAQLIDEIHTEVAFFFLNNPFEKTLHEFWEWFTGYIYLRGDVIDGKEAAASLSFYEQLIDMIKSIHGILGKINELNPAEI